MNQRYESKKWFNSIMESLIGKRLCSTWLYEYQTRGTYIHRERELWHQIENDVLGYTGILLDCVCNYMDWLNDR